MKEEEKAPFTKRVTEELKKYHKYQADYLMKQSKTRPTYRQRYSAKTNAKYHSDKASFYEKELEQYALKTTPASESIAVIPNKIGIIEDNQYNKETLSFVFQAIVIVMKETKTQRVKLDEVWKYVRDVSEKTGKNVKDKEEFMKILEKLEAQNSILRLPKTEEMILI